MPLGQKIEKPDPGWLNQHYRSNRELVCVPVPDLRTNARAAFIGREILNTARDFFRIVGPPERKRWHLPGRHGLAVGQRGGNHGVHLAR